MLACTVADCIPAHSPLAKTRKDSLQDCASWRLRFVVDNPDHGRAAGYHSQTDKQHMAVEAGRFVERGALAEIDTLVEFGKPSAVVVELEQRRVVYAKLTFRVKPQSQG